MRITFFVSNYSSPVFPMKGHFFKVICEGLAERGIDVSVIAPLPYTNAWIEKFWPRLKGYRLVPVKEINNGVTIYRLRYLNFPFTDRLRLRPWLIYRSLDRLKNELKPQLIDFRNSYPSYPYGDVVEKLSIHWKVPYLYTINGQEFPLKESAPRFITSRLKHYAKGAARMLAVSNEIVSEVKRLTGVRTELIVHPVGVHGTQIGVEEKCAIRRSLELETDKQYFLYAGELSDMKGTDVLLSAFRQMKLTNVVLLLIGTVAHGAFSFGENEIHLGLRPQQDVFRYMQACDLFLFPSRSEGMPNVLKEAGAAGIPVIASDVGGIPDLLGDGERGILMPDISSESLVSCIEQVLADPTGTIDRAERLRQHIEKNYTVAASSEKLISIYREVLEISARLSNLNGSKEKL